MFESDSPWILSLTAISSLLLVLVTSYVYRFFSAHDETKIHQLGGISIFNAREFFDKRHDFLRLNREKTGQDLFSFKIFQHEVVAMSGEEARKAFFGDKDLSLKQGHLFLRGAFPLVNEIDSKKEIPATNTQIRRMLHIFRKDRLQEALPTLLNDLDRCMKTWGTAGRMDPFKDIYDLIFQMSIRMASCDELATDAETVRNISDIYFRHEKSVTAASLLLPWFPSAARKEKNQTITALYKILSHYVDLRRKGEMRNSDTIDVLLTQGGDDASIIDFMLLIIFGGVANTAMMATWVLLFLGANSEWKNKAIGEVRNLMATHSNSNSYESMHQRLSTIPLSTWEDETPIIDNVIRETLRLVKNGAALRRSVADNFRVGDKTIDKGAFLAYHMADVHLNGTIYSEPLKFDPGRFSPPREEDKRANFVFLAWGAGRHVCTGMRFAKLEIKMILAMLLSSYEYKLVDEAGKPPKQPPQPDRNDMLQSRPIGQQYFLQYKKFAE